MTRPSNDHRVCAPRPETWGLGLLLFAMLAPWAGNPAQAAIATTALADCAAILSDQARLACYDRLSGGPAAPMSVTDSQPVSAPLSAAAAPDAGGRRVTEPLREPSLIDKAWGFDPDSVRYGISLYQRNYLLFANYTDRINEHPFTPIFNALEVEDQALDSIEARFQISFKFRMWATEDRRWGVWAAYTQMSQWQVYNDAISSPFRDTNYMPELMLSYRPGIQFAGFDWNLLNIGYNHQSNGRSDPISRSWDRLIVSIGIERGDFALILRPWIRLDDEDSDDDNPDITDYMGYGDITAYFKWRDHSFSLMGRGNPSTGKGSAELTWMTPKLLGPLRFYLRGFTGYGDSLIDYNWRQNTIGAGIALNDSL
ncbi:phospholipase A [Thiohalocapsa marina]|uniref:phospholipase A n=1 Tax=Thiohalocapsa marina TaxID=424902 RepID=UPI0036DF2793